MATSNCPHTHLEEFKPGTEPRSFCPLHGENASAKLPHLIGKNVDEASRELKNLGFEGRVVKQYSMEEKNTVISQSPAPGTTYRIGNSVTIVVSIGPPSGGSPRR
ncbi:MAG: PASTA domain-containing protein [Actinomycetota bacterium]|nr:PASTA domain-containing protein [Actinomycetota bacterium]